jgi:spore maturation protein CgeB
VKIARIIGLKNVILLPEGYDELLYYPRKLKPEESQKYSSDISLVGFQYPYRLLAVSGIKGYNFKLWGKVTGDISYYPSLINCAENRFLTGIEKNIIFNASKISLNIHHIGEIDSLNVRSFEICGASGFQIMDYRETANNFYVIGKEIVTYNSLEELVKKINYYLKNSEERRKIALAGYKRAVKDHKLSSRLRILLNNVNKL